MKRIFLLLAVLLLAFPSIARASPIGAAVAEADGDPSGWAYKFVFPSGTIALVNGVATYTDAGGGGGDVSAVGPGCATGACFTDGVVTTGTTMFIWEGTAADGNEFSLISPSANPGADIDITFPSATGTLINSTASLADLADGTITTDFVNTTSPWADNEVADSITISGTGAVDPDALTGDTTDDDLLDAASIISAGGTDEYLISYEATGSKLVADIPIGAAGGVQAWDTDLDTWAVVTSSASGRALVSAANYAAMKVLTGWLTDFVDETAPVAGGDLNMSTFGIYGAFTNLTAASATPSVAVGMNFLTANATADVAITDFTDTTVGMPFRVVITDSFTDIDFTSASLNGHGEVLLDDPPIGTMLTCIDDGTRIDCDVSQWTALALSVFISPMGTTPAQTANGSRFWDSDTFEDTVGNGTTREVFVPTGTKTDEMACSYEATGNNIDCDGSVGALTSTGTITSSGTFDATGAVAMTFGSADITSMTFTTDGTGNAEFTFPADVIGEADIDWGAGAGQISCADIGTTDCGAVGGTTGTFSGNLQGLVTPVEDADGNAALAAGDCAGQAYYNTTQANVYILPAAAPGLNACFYATSAHAVTIRPLAAGNDHIWYGGADCGEDDDLVSPATIGSFVCLHARDAVNWMAWGSANTWVCE